MHPNLYPRALAAIDKGKVTLWDLTGFLPSFINELDERDAVTQLDSRYGHGGGWRDFEGFTFNDKEGGPTLTYPGDPPYHAVAWWKLHGKERIILFDSAWVAVVQPDGSCRVARMD